MFERQIDGNQEEEFHQHWKVFMPDLEIAFPHLEFEPDEEEEDDQWNDWDNDEIQEWAPLELSSGKHVYPDGGFEIVEYRVKVQLNNLGQAWLQTLDVMETAGFIEIDMDKKTFVSVASWHGRDV
jgi:hypothetical protein